MGEPILSICIVTMNRADQLKEALESCLACQLPAETEFVVLDNASSDATGEIVRTVFENSVYPCIYERSEENLGAGGGRARYYEIASGKYVYGMDDDAVIDWKKSPDFFIRAVEILDRHPEIATLATQIFDLAWGKNRLDACGRPYDAGIYQCKMFCGGSHFLRKNAFTEQPYLRNQYGYEELPPSLLAADRGFVNAFCPELSVEHRPRINKWDRREEQNHEFLINDCAIPYAIKKMMYPVLFYPILWLAFERRCAKHLKSVPEGRRNARILAEKTIRQYPITGQIRAKTVLRLAFTFGLSAF